MSEEWWMMNDEWWMMNDEWWMMNDEWWMMNDEWWMMNDEWWMMNDVWGMMYEEKENSNANEVILICTPVDDSSVGGGVEVGVGVRSIAIRRNFRIRSSVRACLQNRKHKCKIYPFLKSFWIWLIEWMLIMSEWMSERVSEWRSERVC
jgi:hypothetical protein